jgi:nitroreductase
MDFFELIKTRQSVRRYTPKPIEPEKIQRLIEVVRLSPSASNSQPWNLIIVDDPALKEKVARATFDPIVTFNRFTVEAPVIAVLVINKPRIITQIAVSITKRELPLIDIGIAATHFCLQATELGLGTCMLGWFNEKKIKEILGIPKEKRIGLLISVGYAPDDYRLREKIRKPVEEMRSFNSY